MLYNLILLRYNAGVPKKQRNIPHNRENCDKVILRQMRNKVKAYLTKVKNRGGSASDYHGFGTINRVSIGKCLCRSCPIFALAGSPVRCPHFKTRSRPFLGHGARCAARRSTLWGSGFARCVCVWKKIHRRPIWTGKRKRLKS